MDQGIKQAVGKQTKAFAQQVAKRAAREPLEVARTAGRQVVGVEVQGMQVLSQPTPETQATAQPTAEDEQKIKERGERVLLALESELKDIRIQNLFENIQRKIASGEQINLSNYPEFSYQQLETLNSQMKAFAAQKISQGIGGKPLVEPVTKRPRKFLAGMQGQVDKLKRKAEIRMPPTG